MNIDIQTIPPATINEFPYPYILTMPRIDKQLQRVSKQQCNQSGVIDKINRLKGLLINYSKQWRFGQIQPIMTPEQYSQICNQYNTPIVPVQQQTQQISKDTIIINIRNLLQLDVIQLSCVINTYFDINLTDIFPALSINRGLVTNLLGLAALIGSEELVILFLMNGANPREFNGRERGAEYNMLNVQLLINKMMRDTSKALGRKLLSTPVQQQAQQQALSQISATNNTGFLNANDPKLQQYTQYVISDERINFILTLLGTSKNGIDISEIQDTQELPNTVTPSISRVPQVIKIRSSNLLDMCSEDTLYNFNAIFTKQSFPQGEMVANIPYNVLFFILRFNKLSSKDATGNIRKIKLIDNGGINKTSTPYNFSPIYLLLANKTLSNIFQKTDLLQLMISCGASPNIKVTESPITPQTDLISLIQSWYPNDYEDILTILKKNPEFAKTVNENYLQKMRQRQYALSGISGMPSQSIYSDPSLIGSLQQQLLDRQRQLDIAQSQLTLQDSLLGRNLLPSEQNQNIDYSQGFYNGPGLPVGYPVPRYPMYGGSRIKMRTFHFPDQKEYDEHIFTATSPKIAAENAYDFLKTHYKLLTPTIVFRIEDRGTGKSYKYSARTKKDGTSVLKAV